MNKKVLIGKLLLLTMFLYSGCSSDEKNVLVIGDSISLGYFPYVAAAMDHNINIEHNKGNAQHTGTGIDSIDLWLGDTGWDVIIFNWGLWDLCYRHPDSQLYGKRDKVNGTITFSIDQYARNLEKLVQRLKETGAELIFISTSYIPPGEGGRIEGDDILYNDIAHKIMDEFSIKYVDINELSKKIHPEYRRSEGDVHFTEKGYEILAEPVIEELKKYL